MSSTLDAESGGSQVQGQPEQCGTRQEGVGDMVQRACSECARLEVQKLSETVKRENEKVVGRKGGREISKLAWGTQ